MGPRAITLALVAGLALAAVVLYSKPRTPGSDLSPVALASPKQASATTPAPPSKEKSLPSRSRPEPEPTLAEERRQRQDAAWYSARLRELRQSDPAQTLELALAAGTLYPTHPDAAEHQWYLVRALVNQGRFEDAREQAELMRQRFGGSSWARDVERHLLVHPLGLPSREQIAQMDR